MATPTPNILVADPDQLQLQLVDLLLASGNYQLEMVQTGRETLERLKSSTPDLAVLALDLPDVEGDVICGKIRRVSRLARMPVILIAPQAGQFGLTDRARARARRVGADLVLPRPLGDKNLRERVQSLLDAREHTPPREGHTTMIIEEALEEIPLDPDARPSEGTAATGEGTAGRAPASEAPRGPSTSAQADAAPEDARTLAQLRREVDRLQLENAQLRRKLTDHASGRRDREQEAQRTIAELERRNKALLDALEDLKSQGGQDGRGGGWFGRRK